MAYVRGNASVEVELARIQSWVEDVDPELKGEKGMIREWRDHQAERRSLMNFFKVIAAVLGGLTAIQAAMEILKAFHLLP